MLRYLLTHPQPEFMELLLIDMLENQQNSHENYEVTYCMSHK